MPAQILSWWQLQNYSNLITGSGTHDDTQTDSKIMFTIMEKKS